MAVTLKASARGLELVDRARREKEWTKYHDAWWGQANSSKSTLKRFWSRKGIDSGTFKALCEVVGIDWQLVADSLVITKESEETLSTPVSQESPLDLPEVNAVGKLRHIPELPHHYLKRTEELEALKRLVLPENEQVLGAARVSRYVGVYGMGGIGKSVLATALAYDYEIDQSLQSAFIDGVIWVNASQSAEVIDIQTRLAAALGVEPDRSWQDPELAQIKLNQILANRSFLIILDDVWRMDQVEAVRLSGSHSKLLITTRKGEILNIFGASSPFMLGQLTLEQALELLSSTSGQERSTLPPEAKKIAKECEYLPLALAIIGSKVGRWTDDWEEYLKRLQNADLEKLERKFPEYPHTNLLKVIQVSIDDLDDDLKQRFWELAIFPEDALIPLVTLQTYWKPMGLDNLDTKEQVQALVNLSLVQPSGDRLYSLQNLLRYYLSKQVSEQEREVLHNRHLHFSA